MIKQYSVIKQNIIQSEQTFNRRPGAVKCLVVSKGRSVEDIKAIYAEGQRDFGENYLQEALPKQTNTPKDIVWHYIGKVQSNKAKKIAAHFDWVETIVDERMAIKLNDHRPTTRPPLNVCIEVNIDASITKIGLHVTKVHELAKFCRQLPNLRLRGLMILPTLSESFEKERAIFQRALELFNDLNRQGMMLDTLSMGTSHDFTAAIAAGSTMVRIGRGIWE